MNDVFVAAAVLLGLTAAATAVCAVIVLRVAKRADEQAAERERQALGRIHGRLSASHPAGKHRR